MTLSMGSVAALVVNLADCNNHRIRLVEFDVLGAVLPKDLLRIGRQRQPARLRLRNRALICDMLRSIRVLRRQMPHSMISGSDHADGARPKRSPMLLEPAFIPRHLLHFRYIGI